MVSCGGSHPEAVCSTRGAQKNHVFEVARNATYLLPTSMKILYVIELETILYVKSFFIIFSETICCCQIQVVPFLSQDYILKSMNDIRLVLDEWHYVLFEKYYSFTTCVRCMVLEEYRFSVNFVATTN